MNLYAYVRGKPTGYHDPSGLTAAGGLTGAGWGGNIGAALGEAIDPFGGGVPGYWIGAGLGAIAGDWWTGPDTVFSKADKGPTEVAPKDCPAGTRPIDRDPRTRRGHQKLKQQLQNGPKDWTGITPDGGIITTNPDRVPKIMVLYLVSNLEMHTDVKL